jgi:hypothetical protein
MAMLENVADGYLCQTATKEPRLFKQYVAKKENSYSNKTDVMKIRQKK